MMKRGGYGDRRGLIVSFNQTIIGHSRLRCPSPGSLTKRSVARAREEPLASKQRVPLFRMLALSGPRASIEHLTMPTYAKRLMSQLFASIRSGVDALRNSPFSPPFRLHSSVSLSARACLHCDPPQYISSYSTANRSVDGNDAENR